MEGPTSADRATDAGITGADAGIDAKTAEAGAARAGTTEDTATNVGTTAATGDATTVTVEVAVPAEMMATAMTGAGRIAATGDATTGGAMTDAEMIVEGLAIGAEMIVEGRNSKSLASPGKGRQDDRISLTGRAATQNHTHVNIVHLTPMNLSYPQGFLQRICILGCGRR